MVRSTSFGSRLFDFCNVVFMVTLGIVMLYPFWHVLVGSVLPYADAIQSKIHLFPTGFDFTGYKYVFSQELMLSSFLISIFVTVVGTIYQLFITAITAYPLTKPDLPGRNGIFIYFIITMFFSGGLIPYYLLIKNLGMINSLSVLIIPAALSLYNVIVLKTFFQGIPVELEESAKIDGAGYMRIFFQIIIPLSIPSLATIALFIAVGAWNNWFTPMLFLNDKDMWPLPLVLRDILINNNMDTLKQGVSIVNESYMLANTIKDAVVIVSILPIILVYPFIQKHFVKGVMIGSIKS